MFKTYKVGESFGDMACMNNSPYPSAVQANGAVELYALNWNDKYSNMVSPYFLEYIIKKKEYKDDKIELKDLDFISQIGKGTYGLVHLVRSKKTKCYYAVKSICKSQIFYDRLSQAIDIEKEVLCSIESPFIIFNINGLSFEKN